MAIILVIEEATAGKAEAEVRIIITIQPRYHQDGTYKGKSAPPGKGKGRKGKGRGAGTGKGQQLVVHLDGKEYMRNIVCYNCGVPGHYASTCVEAWKQHNERSSKRGHRDINTLFKNGDKNYFGEDDEDHETKLEGHSAYCFKLHTGAINFKTSAKML